jgi:hypothetical protein
LCGQCFKACPHDNMQLLVRLPFPDADTREPAANWPVTLFIMLLSGFVTWELFTEWKPGEAVFLVVPQWVAANFGTGAVATGFLKWLWALVIIPAGLWVGMAAGMKMAGEPGRIGLLLRRMAPPMALIVAAGHMSKGVAKFVSWGPFLPGALEDTTGIATAQAITAQALATPAPLVGLSAVSWMGLMLVAAALAFAIREYQRAQRGSGLRVRAAIPHVVLATAYAGIIAHWV